MVTRKRWIYAEAQRTVVLADVRARSLSLDSGADDIYRSRIGIVSELGGSTTVGGIGPSWTLGYGSAKPPEDVLALTGHWFCVGP